MLLISNISALICIPTFNDSCSTWYVGVEIKGYATCYSKATFSLCFQSHDLYVIDRRDGFVFLTHRKDKWHRSLFRTELLLPRLATCFTRPLQGCYLGQSWYCYQLTDQCQLVLLTGAVNHRTCSISRDGKPKWISELSDIRISKICNIDIRIYNHPLIWKLNGCIQISFQ